MRKNNRFVGAVIRDVVRTFSADPAASSEMLRTLLSPDSLRDNGYNDAPAIARELPNVYNVDPVFARDAYIAIMSAHEPSTDKTDMSGSSIMGFTSNKRQDLDHAKWQLGEDFDKFLSSHPEEATVAMARALQIYSDRHTRDHTTSQKFSLTFDGTRRALWTDLSRVWDQSPVVQHDPETVMATKWAAWLPSAFEDDKATFERCFNEYLNYADRAVLWRKLLLLAMKFPETIGVRIASLLTQRAILTAYDTTDAAGELIRRLWTHLEGELRSSIVTAIFRIRVRDRDRLLECIPTDLRPSSVNALIESRRDRIRTNRLEPGIEVSTTQYTREDFLTESGVDTEKQQNRSVNDQANRLDNQVAVFRSAAQGTGTESLFDLMDELEQALNARDVDYEQALFGWNAIASACEVLCRNPHLEHEELEKVVRAVELVYDFPAPEWDSNFDDHGSWGGPEPHVPAANAVAELLAKNKLNQRLSLIERAAAVRFKPARAHIAANLALLLRELPDLAWELARRFAMR